MNSAFKMMNFVFKMINSAACGRRMASLSRARKSPALLPRIRIKCRYHCWNSSLRTLQINTSNVLIRPGSCASRRPTGRQVPYLEKKMYFPSWKWCFLSIEKCDCFIVHWRQMLVHVQCDTAAEGGTPGRSGSAAMKTIVSKFNRCGFLLFLCPFLCPFLCSFGAKNDEFDSEIELFFVQLLTGADPKFIRTS